MSVARPFSANLLFGVEGDGRKPEQAPEQAEAKPVESEQPQEPQELNEEPEIPKRTSAAPKQDGSPKRRATKPKAEKSSSRRGRPRSPQVEDSISLKLGRSIVQACENACTGPTMAKLPRSLRARNILVMGYIMGSLGVFPDDIPDDIKRVGYAYQQQHSEDATVANLVVQVRELSSVVGRQTREIAVLERLIALLIMGRFGMTDGDYWTHPVDQPSNIGYDDPRVEDIVVCAKHARQAQDHREHVRLRPNTRRG